MGGVGDEVGFGQLLAQLVGAVAQDREDGALVGQRASGHRVGAVADPQRRVGGEADFGGALQLRQHRLRRLPGGVEQAAGGAVGEADRAFVVDDHHHVGKAVEDRRQLVAIGGQHPEALLQRGAHRLEGAGEVTDLVGAGGGQRSVEGAARHLAGGAGQADDAVGDRDRDHQAGEDAEGDRGDQRLRLVAEEVDRRRGD